jgi:hypothetical protein
MNLSKYNLNQLFKIREQLLLEGSDLTDVNEEIFEKERQLIELLQEDGPGGAAAAASIGVGGGGVAYANASIAGTGNVVNAQPSSYAGATTGDAYSKGGGFDGSGDISVPYNPGGRKKVFLKQKGYDDRKGQQNRRRNKFLGSLKNILSAKQDYTANQGNVKGGKIMNFDNFAKDKMNQVTKVKQ